MRGLQHNKAYEKATYTVSSLLQSDDPFEVGIALRILGNEYGSTTNRPRRTGMLDLVQLSYAVRMNGVDTVFLNKCDLLNDFSKTKAKTMPVVTGYKLHGKSIDYVPGSNTSYRNVVPVVEEYPSFTETITDLKTYATLPKELKKLLQDMEEKIHCPVLGIGTGAKRNGYVLFQLW